MSIIPIVVQNKKCLHAFKEAGAVGEAQAKTLAEIQVKDGRVLKRLLKLKAIAASGDKYYVTEAFATTQRFKNA